MKPENTAKLVETHKVLHEEFSTMQAISETMLNTTSTFKTINSTYDNYGTEISFSRRFLREIKARITMQDLVFYICFYLFLATCAWIFLKRFGLNLIVEWVFSCVYSLFAEIKGIFSSGDL